MKDPDDPNDYYDQDENWHRTRPDAMSESWWLGALLLLLVVLCVASWWKFGR